MLLATDTSELERNGDLFLVMCVHLLSELSKKRTSQVGTTTLKV